MEENGTENKFKLKSVRTEGDFYEKLCRTGQILWRKHELMWDEFQNPNSMDCFLYEEHIEGCEECRAGLGL